MAVPFIRAKCMAIHVEKKIKDTFINWSQYLLEIFQLESKFQTTFDCIGTW